MPSKRETFKAAMLALGIWLSLMPIHIVDVPVRGGKTVPVYVWMFYNHLVAFYKRPEAFLDGHALGAFLIYSIPGITHIFLSWKAAKLALRAFRHVGWPSSPDAETQTQEH